MIPGPYKVSLEYLVIPERRKLSKTIRVTSKDPGANLKAFPVTKDERI